MSRSEFELLPQFLLDIIIWDSHPLSLGATPRQVYIDGIAQLHDPHNLTKPSNYQDLPKPPNWDREAEEAVKWDGIPPLTDKKNSVVGKTLKIEGVKSAWHYGTNGDVESLFDEDHEGNRRTIFVQDGQILCVDTGNDHCGEYEAQNIDKVVDLQGGSLAPGLTTYGSPLGLVEIRSESSTNDGDVSDPLVDGGLPSILGSNTIIRAVDGLQFQGRNALSVLLSFLIIYTDSECAD